MGRTSRHYLIVGVDFGTTYTGLSYALSADPDDEDIEIVRDWPTSAPDTKEHAAKAPTQIAYQDDTTGNSKWRWGYQIDPGEVRYAWMKLLLDRNARQTAYDDAGLKSDIDKGAIKMPDDKSAQDVAADFLKEIYHLMMKRLERDYSKILSLTPIKFWFTMPAIWSDEAQTGTLAAAKRAGFGSRRGDEICMIAEPEAAALATLSSPSLGYYSQLEDNDGFLICDCGGGTVDLTAYTILGDDPLQLAECCVGEGGKCGGTSVDRKIIELLARRFVSTFDPLDQKNVGQGSKFMRAFDWNKRNFGKQGFKLRNLPYILKNEPTPNPSQYDSVEHEIILTEADMLAVFDPVVKKVLELVAKQVRTAMSQGRTPIKALILVGGFGESPYLQQKLKAWCDTYGIKLSVPGDSWGAVAKGAVIRGLEMATVVRKKCRRHYGTLEHRPFKSGIDKESESFFCPFGGKRAPGYMAWPIVKGEDIVLDTFKSLPFYMALDEGQRTISVDLKSCSKDQAPTRFEHGDVEDVGKIVTDLTNVDMSRFTVTEANGRKTYKFDYQLEVVLGHKQGTIYFRIRALGEIIGQTCIDFSK